MTAVPDEPGVAQTVRAKTRLGHLSRARNLLPQGALAVGAGLLVLGVSAYAFLAVAARALPAGPFATLSVLWVLVYTVGPGLFLPLEQEVGRALADRRARGLGGGPLLRRAATLGLALVGVLLVATVAFGSPLVAHLFSGSWLVLAGLLLSFVGLCGAHLSRGALAGTGRFGRYGAQLAVEGIARVLGCVALAALAVRSAGGYGIVIGSALVVSVLATLPGPRQLTGPGPDASWSELSGALGWLFAGALLAQLLANAGPVAVKVLATPAEEAAAGQLLAGLVLARLPLFLFAAVQAALLPRLAGLVGAGRHADFVAALRRLLAGVAAVALLAAVVLGVAGPQLLRLIFGSRFTLGAAALAELGAATGLYMFAIVLANSLLALRGYAMAAAGWAAGVATFAVVVALGSSVLTRVEHGYLAGTLVSAVVLGLLLRAALFSARPATGPRAQLPTYALFEP